MDENGNVSLAANWDCGPADYGLVCNWPRETPSTIGWPTYTPDGSGRGWMGNPTAYLLCGGAAR